jgi:hypothetical protein
MEEFAAKLRCFISGEDRSPGFVRSINDLLYAVTPQDIPLTTDLYEDLEIATACFRPGGGQFMYDEEQVAAIFAAVLERLRTA